MGKWGIVGTYAALVSYRSFTAFRMTKRRVVVIPNGEIVKSLICQFQFCPSGKTGNPSDCRLAVRDLYLSIPAYAVLREHPNNPQLV